MRAGELRHRLLHKKRVLTRQSNGSFVETVTNGKTLYGAIRPVNSKEASIFLTARPDITHIITMRYSTGVKPADSMVYDGRTFELGPAIYQEETRIMMQFTAIEKL